MADLPTIKGRKPVGALLYYHCRACGAPTGGIYLAGFEGNSGHVLISEEGAIFSFREGYPVPDWVRVKDVIGRIPCPNDGERSLKGDHVFYDWEFAT